MLVSVERVLNMENKTPHPLEPLVMLPYYDQDGITIYNADCRTAMRALRPSWIVTDPPYGINYDGAKYKKWSGQELGWNKIQNDDGNLDLEFIFRAEGNKVVFGADNYLNKIEYKGSWIIWDKRVVLTAYENPTKSKEIG